MTAQWNPGTTGACCGTTMDKNVVIEKLQVARAKVRQAVYDPVTTVQRDKLLQEVEQLLTEVLG